MLNGSGTVEVHLPNWMRESVFLTLLAIIDAGAQSIKLISVKRFRPEEVLLVFLTVSQPSHMR